MSKELLLLDKARNIVIRRSKSIIVNESKYPLVYVNHGDNCGYFFSDALSAFQHSSNISKLEGLNFMKSSLRKINIFYAYFREDGNTDEKGKISNHGVTTNGIVKDIESLVHQVKHATLNSPLHVFDERCRYLKLRCEFENNLVSKFIFTVSDENYEELNERLIIAIDNA